MAKLTLNSLKTYVRNEYNVWRINPMDVNSPVRDSDCYETVGYFPANIQKDLNSLLSAFDKDDEIKFTEFTKLRKSTLKTRKLGHIVNLVAVPAAVGFSNIIPLCLLPVGHLMGEANRNLKFEKTKSITVKTLRPRLCSLGTQQEVALKIPTRFSTNKGDLHSRVTKPKNMTQINLNNLEYNSIKVYNPGLFKGQVEYYEYYDLSVRTKYGCDKWRKYYIDALDARSVYLGDGSIGIKIKGWEHNIQYRKSGPIGRFRGKKKHDNLSKELPDTWINIDFDRKVESKEVAPNTITTGYIEMTDVVLRKNTVIMHSNFFDIEYLSVGDHWFKLQPSGSIRLGLAQVSYINVIADTKATLIFRFHPERYVETLTKFGQFDKQTEIRLKDSLVMDRGKPVEEIAKRIVSETNLPLANTFDFAVVNVLSHDDNKVPQGGNGIISASKPL